MRGRQHAGVCAKACLRPRKWYVRSFPRFKFEILDWPEGEVDTGDRSQETERASTPASRERPPTEELVQIQDSDVDDSKDDAGGEVYEMVWSSRLQKMEREPRVRKR